MNKKSLNKIIILIILILLFEIFDHSSIINNTIINSSIIWFKNIIPSILPIYITIDLLLNYNFINSLDFILNIFSKIFKINNNSAIIILLSILSGFPSNSKYINTMLENNLINKNDANKILLFTHFSNPLFIINTIGNNFLHSKNIGIIILISHYITNIIIGLLIRNYNTNVINNQKYEFKNINFINCLINSIFNTLKILFLLYGIITIFMIINTLINENIALNNVFKAILSGILEITNGIYNISNLNINIIYKSVIITFFISFGGLCIHMQVFGILKDYKLNYISYLKTRIFHGIISSSLVYIFLKFII